jgi:hypothetical protein
MSGDDERPPVVLVRVEVNVDSMRRGDEREVELTPRTRKMISAGYLRILGHVSLPPVLAPAVPAPPPEPIKLASPRRTRVAAKAQEGGDGDGPASGDHPQP